MIRAPPTAPLTRVRLVPSVVPPNAPSPSSPAEAAAAAAAAARAAVNLPISPSTPTITLPINNPSLSPPVYIKPTEITLSHKLNARESEVNHHVLSAATAGTRNRETYLSREVAVVAPPKRATKRKNATNGKGKRTKKAIREELEQFTSNSRKENPGIDSIRSYLREIGEVKLLDGDMEVSLARQIARLLELERLSSHLKAVNGRHPNMEEWADAASMDIKAFRSVLRMGLRAKEHMVAANLRLVVSIAKKYLNRGLTFQDLIQEGSIGLIRGAEKFDGDKGFKFSTYATWWIRQAITRSIADHSRPIRLPVHVNDTISAIRKTSKQLTAELSRPPSEIEIAKRMNISLDKLRFISRSSRSTLSLETPVGKNLRESNATLGSFIMWTGDTPEDATMKTLLREDLENVLNTLSPRERDVVRMRYGFDDGKMKTLEEIGTIFAVTRERIRQIEAKALRKLRHPTRNAVLREYVYGEN